LARYLAHSSRNTVKQIAMNNNMDEFKSGKLSMACCKRGWWKSFGLGMEQKKITLASGTNDTQSPAEKRSVVTKLIEELDVSKN
jgi:hypothetical protein